MAVLRPLAWLFALLLLVVAAIAVFALTFDANRYKPELVTLVKEKPGVTSILMATSSFPLPQYRPATGAGETGQCQGF